MTKSKAKLLAVLTWLAVACGFAPAWGASLLPNGEQTFLDANGAPLAAGKVFFYIPTTSTPKNTWFSSVQTAPNLNTNPVVLDAAGRAIIYGSGTYRQVVQDVFGNVIWDQLTADAAAGALISWGGTSAGTVNAQTVDGSSFGQLDGQAICFRAGLTNTGAMTITPSGGSPAIAVRRDTPGGPQPLAGGEVFVGNTPCVLYESTTGTFHMLSNPQYSFTVLSSITGNTTTDLGTIASHNVNITGTATITSFGSSAISTYPLYFLTFAGASILTYNATSMILPGGGSITTAAGDTAIAAYLGSGNWKVIQFTSLASPVAPQVISGTFRNLVVTGTSNTQVTETADALTVETTAGIAFRLSTVSVTCDITTSGLNGLDTGAEASNTWYSTWVIYAPSTAATGCLLSTSATAPTMPATYTAKVRTGWVRNDVSSNLWRSIQHGNTATIIVGTNPTVSPVITSGTVGTYSTTSPTLSAVSVTSFVPTTAAAIYMAMDNGYNAGATASFQVAGNTAWGGANRGPFGSAGNNWPLIIQSTSGGFATAIWLELEGTTVGFASSGAGAGLSALGWRDNL